MNIDLRRYRWVWALWLVALVGGIATGNLRLVSCCVATVVLTALAVFALYRSGQKPGR